MPVYKYRKNSQTVLWSNGRTRGFGPRGGGSNPSGTTRGSVETQE